MTESHLCSFTDFVTSKESILIGRKNENNSSHLDDRETNNTHVNLSFIYVKIKQIRNLNESIIQGLKLQFDKFQIFTDDLIY